MLAPPPTDEIHVFTVDVARAATPARLARYRALLTPDEAARHQRFVRPEDRDRFLVTRALVRTALSRYVPVDPRDWRFVENPYGRPEILAPALDLPLRFNLSHTPGLVACAVTVGRDIGIDVEHIGRTLHHDVAGRFFAPREVADLEARPATQRPHAFFDYWTLKEAYIKACGLGLAIPLDHFAFDLAGDGPPRVSFAPERADDPGHWQFAQFWPTAEHRMAVAVRRAGPDLPIAIRAAIPLEPEG